MQIFIYSPRLHAPELAVEEALRIEKLGYDGIAMPDHIFVPNFNTGRPNPYAHGLTILAAAAAAIWSSATATKGPALTRMSRPTDAACPRAVSIAARSRSSL